MPSTFLPPLEPFDYLGKAAVMQSKAAELAVTSSACNVSSIVRSFVPVQTYQLILVI